MLRRIIGLLVLYIIMCGLAFAHSGKPKFHVIIDTDGAIDDMRAISMFLSCNDVRVIAISCSQGTLFPDMVYEKITALLSAFHHDGIPVGKSEKVNYELPSWTTFARNVEWGAVQNGQQEICHKNAKELLISTLENYPDKVTLIALGSLKTYADLLKENRKVEEKIDRIIWYNNHSIEEGFNYKVSPDSYEYLKNSGIILEVVANNSDDLLVDQEYLNHIHHSSSIYAVQIENVHSQASVINKIKATHLHLWDDVIPLYLTTPVLFDTETRNDLKFVSINQQLPSDFIYETIGKLLISATTTNNRVFTVFPIDSGLYKMEYAKMLNKTISKFGLIEWKAISMTNEIHGHTGIYSIIGAKMGIRAMEYFNVGVNNMEVLTFAGSEPPSSCLNDGIQISTGATIGQGLITISDSTSKIPSAIFEFNNQKVSISLKAEIAGRIKKEIEYGVKNYGLLSDKYWLYIEALAIKYWEDLDRHKIFEVQKLSSNQ